MKKIIGTLFVGATLVSLYGLPKTAQAASKWNIIDLEGSIEIPGWASGNKEPEFVIHETKTSGVPPLIIRHTKGGKTGFLTRKEYYKLPNSIEWYAKYSGHIQ
ncbi:hypothetical protein A5821_003340 [Enterococcus sp. 7F3_DIV0205]|uniref:Uncharacterized protein n=1 Tax=Candidatus Enterococcus palustris TaxID=1834189 RepID=A0AAQ3WCN0_9ENTE|nr:hypothetical protein [Enterococcus sp. 7F3_DIV0205]OTN84222.1 hypothetical protein A5821_000148 [Enterococcus sp. 7F3_DIV0205]